MPELPEVEALAVFLREHAVGQAVARVDVAAISALKTYSPPPSALAGLTLGAVARHGKFLDLDCDGLHLVTHLARAGWLHWRAQLPPAPPKPGKGPLALRVHLSGGGGFDLTEAGTQKRLAVYIVRDPGEVPGVARLGVDPLSEQFTTGRLAELLTASGRSQIKGVLTDQTLIAGIGNAYSDEILWVARRSPFSPAVTLAAEPALSELHDAVRSTLGAAATRAAGRAAAELKGEKRSGLSVHGRTGQPCPRCGNPVREVSFAESSLQYCPTCQTGGKTLADRRLSKLLR